MEFYKPSQYTFSMGKDKYSPNAETRPLSKIKLRGARFLGLVVICCIDGTNGIVNVHPVLQNIASGNTGAALPAISPTASEVLEY